MTGRTLKAVGQQAGRPGGASKAAIQAHYDVGNDFYSLWLDQSMTYSCAIWDDQEESLETAQDRKVEYHVSRAVPSGASNVLEVGSGWGACLKKLSLEKGVAAAVGLTLSDAQKTWVDNMGLPGVEVRVESWTEHDPQVQYDAILSLAAIAHFVRPDLHREDRIRVYREFFSSCHDWLRPGGKMTIETQVYGNGSYISDSPLSEIFPESDMPHLPELVEGFDGIFELDALVNHRRHYPKTLRCWLNKMVKNREAIESIVGSEVAEQYMRFLKGGIRGHESGVFALVRIDLSKTW